MEHTALFAVRLLRATLHEGATRLAGTVIQLDAEGAAGLVRAGHAVVANESDLPRMLSAAALRHDRPHLRLVKR
jgi:hypothetical protein